jgi:alkylhydroperoxidase family enzyme
MPRIRPLKEEDAAAESRVHFQNDRSAFGTALNSTAVYAHCPPILSAAKALGAAVEKSGRLPKQLRCLLNVRAAGMVGCPF